MPSICSGHHNRFGRRRWFAACLMAGLLGAPFAGAQTTAPWTSEDATPSFRIVKGTATSPDAAWSYYGAATTATDGLCRDYGANSQICPNGTRPRPPELKELARALKNDPDLIYEYVRNTIDTEFLFGLHKGALGASIDKSGGAFDQAQLMVELLREAGFNARYRYGDITLTAGQFYDWTGVTKAKAACELLAAGGIPALVNGSATSCEISGDVSGVTLAHVWVEADLPGGTYQFDPSFKPYSHKAGIDVASAMGLQAGQAAGAAAATVSRSSDGKTVTNYSNAGVAGVVQSYADTLRNRLQNTDLQGANLGDVIGGDVLVPVARPVGGWRQASLPYVGASRATWADIPNQFRTVLGLSGQYPSGASPLSVSFYADEIYGRRLTLSTWVMPGKGWAPSVVFDGVFLTKTTPIAPNGVVAAADDAGIYKTVLSVNHPFAAGAGAYGDVSVSRRMGVGDPLVIIQAWGATSPALSSKWASEVQAYQTYVDASGNAVDVSVLPADDLPRLKVAAAWLAQYSQASRIHGRLAGTRVLNLHTVGFAFDIYNHPAWTTEATDRVTLLDLETSVAATSLSGDASARRAALQALAATAAALEGGVPEQVFDTPDTASTARRFAWANNPDSSVTPGPRPLVDNNGLALPDLEAIPRAAIPFQRIATTDSAPAASSFAPTAWTWPEFDTRPSLAAALKVFHDKGFDIVTSTDALLGPGSTGGSYSTCQQCPGFNDSPSTQRGGAFVATKYDANGDPNEIAHIVSNLYTASKGGGGAVPSGPMKDSAESLRDKFVDRSKVLGVDLSSGRVSYGGDVVKSVGSGEFPYRLDETLAVRGQGLSPYRGSQARANLQRITSGLVSNFDGAVEVSSSGLEAMGATRIEAAAPTLAAFAAMQDTYKSAALADRDVAGLLIADWWGRRLLSNVATLHQGASAAQYVEAGALGGERLFLPAEGGASRLLVAGTTTVVRPNHFDDEGNRAVSAQRMNLLSGLSIREVSGGGDERKYQYWSWGNYTDTSFQMMEYFSGFRLNTWSLKRGVTLTVNYAAANQTTSFVNFQGATLGYPTPSAIPLSISSSLGRVLTLSTTPWDIQVKAIKDSEPDATDDSQHCRPLGNYLPGNTSGAHVRAYTEHVFYNPGAGRTAIRFGAPSTRTPWRRPMDSCPIIAIYTPGDQATPQTQYVYDSLGRVLEASDGLAIRSSSARSPYRFYIAEGYRGERVDPAGGAYAVETLPAGGQAVDGVTAGKMTRHIDELGRVTISLYDGRGRVLERAFPEGNKSRFKYDARDNVVELRQVAKPNTGLADQVVTASWDAAWNKPAWVQDANNNRTTFTYVASGAGAGEIYQAVQPAVGGVNPTWTYEYAANGLVSAATDPTGVRTETAYDGLGNPIRVTIDPAGKNIRTCFKYDAAGNVTGQTDPRAASCP